jgi:excisionase family DNA binding protein
MTTRAAHQNDLIIPDIRDSRIAEKSSKDLALLDTNRIVTIQIKQKNNVTTTVEIPGSAFRGLVNILKQMGKGNSVTTVPVHKELSSQEVANLLGVSRPYLVKLADDGHIPSHKIGTHRRFHSIDVMKYKAKTMKAREKTLKKLTQQAQKLNMGYDD